jgi:hypothetical protein
VYPDGKSTARKYELFYLPPTGVLTSNGRPEGGESDLMPSMDLPVQLEINPPVTSAKVYPQ